MSQPPFIPPVDPLPVESLPAESLPAETLPAEIPPVKILPVEMLPPVPEGYMEGTWGRRSRRPGIVTAIGVISIVVGSLGIFGGGLSALYGGMFYMMGQISSTMQRQQFVIPQPAVTPVADAATDADGPIVTEITGVEADQRKLIIDGLAKIRPLNDARRTQLDALFAKVGQDAFPGSDKNIDKAVGGNVGGGISSTTVSQTVGSSGPLPPSATDSTGQPADYFELLNGRIEVDDNRALFAPKDHSVSPTRVARTIAGQAAPVPPPPVVPPAPAQPPLPFSNRGPVNGTTAVLVITEGAISLLLSIYLLVVGILALRQHKSGRRLHVIYIVLKVPLAVGCAIGWWYLLGDFFQAVRMPAGQVGPEQGARVTAIFLVLIMPLVYPISLMFTMLTPTVKRYFDSGIAADV